MRSSDRKPIELIHKLANKAQLKHNKINME